MSQNRDWGRVLIVKDNTFVGKRIIGYEGSQAVLARPGNKQVREEADVRKRR
jgi:hypothetical protein